MREKNVSWMMLISFLAVVYMVMLLTNIKNTGRTIQRESDGLHFSVAELKVP